MNTNTMQKTMQLIAVWSTHQQNHAEGRNTMLSAMKCTTVCLRMLHVSKLKITDAPANTNPIAAEQASCTAAARSSVPYFSMRNGDTGKNTPAPRAIEYANETIYDMPIPISIPTSPRNIIVTRIFRLLILFASFISFTSFISFILHLRVTSASTQDVH